MAGAGVPPEMIQPMLDDPRTVKMAPTMLHDIEIMGEDQIRRFDPRRHLQDHCTTDTGTCRGGASPQFFRNAAERLAGLVPRAELHILPGTGPWRRACSGCRRRDDSSCEHTGQAQ